MNKKIMIIVLCVSFIIILSLLVFSLEIQTSLFGKTVTEVCKPIYKTEHIGVPKFVNTPCKTINLSCQTTYMKRTMIPGTQQIQIGCQKTGEINVNSESYNYKNFFCKLNKGRNKIICYSNIDGRGHLGEGPCLSGETCYEIDIKTNKKTFTNSLRTKLMEEYI